MAFDDLTPDQKRRMKGLIDALETGRYKDEFLITETSWENTLVYLYTHKDGKAIRVESLTRGDIQAFLSELPQVLGRIAL